MSWLGIDMGGTFTDFVWYSADAPEPRIVKVPSSPSDFRGVLAAGLKQLPGSIADVGRIVLGTTLATNTILEGDGARVATITTRGYRDIVEIGRQTRFEMYNLKTLRRKSLSPRRWRHEIDERTDWTGATTPVSTDEIDEVIRLLDKDEVEAVAVCFLFSFLNDDNERQVVDELTKRSQWYVTASHEIARQSKEYERFATTLLNAFVGPRTDQFLHEFEEYLAEYSMGRHQAFLMGGNGGSMTIDAARVSPVRIINSGPAGGVQASLEVGRLVGARNIITCDMGGTSTDVCLINDLQAVVTSEGYLDRVPFIVPHLDLVTIGTGGGSIAWVDIGGELEVGPHSAGAVPGPACYGRGGVQPTVTDANVVLGRLSESRPLGGALEVDRALADMAISQLLPRFPGLSVMELADGVVRLAVARMATALREVSVARGLDPRDFTLVAYGGAGPMHATELAKELEILHVVVPPMPGNFSALGLIMSDLRYDFVQSRTVRVTAIEVDEYEHIFQELEDEARRRLESEGFSEREILIARTADMRFAGQWFELNVPAPSEPKSMSDLDDVFRRFHLERYKVDMDRPAEFAAFRVSARGLVQKPSLVAPSASGAVTPTRFGSVYLDGELKDVPVFDRSSLPIGATIEGPAIVEEFGSTTVVAAGFTGHTDEAGALVMTYSAEEDSQ